MIKKTISLLFIMLIFNIFCYSEENPLREFINDKAFKEAVSRFPSKDDIFKTKVTSRDDIDKVLNTVRGRIKGTFLEVIMITINDIEKSMGRNYSAIFYYKNGEDRRTRKTITGRDKMQVGDHIYLVKVLQNGIKVTDNKTGVHFIIEKKKVR